MSRVNWMNIATWLVLAVCVLLAFFIGYYGLNNLNNALTDRDAVQNQIAIQDTAARNLERSHRPLADTLAYPDNGKEEYDFLSQLQLLMTMAGVRQVQLERTSVTSLPSIAKVTEDPQKKEPRTSQRSENRAGVSLEPSLTNLPLGARARSTNLAVQGPFASVRQFTYLVQNYRYRKRAINLNSIQIVPVDEKGTVRATLTLTRFVRPADDQNPAPASGPATDNQTPRLPPGTPDTPGMPGNPGTPARPGVQAVPSRDSANP
jgi:hypothetical protein